MLGAHSVESNAEIVNGLIFLVYDPYDHYHRVHSSIMWMSCMPQIKYLTFSKVENKGGKTDLNKKISNKQVLVS